ncbi:uncharacterized protein LOC125677558 [Ostrea edulis]|uniref:uncharacterized protein LOC130052822 n=1 Tax=Ostrea edulis TaxID=37623 RepID=UPI0024AE99AC|nr:uncharacterized protein LOC130052822 [Ostrea edulis]XP_056014877.1 uncharacterized protein LOC130052825 [Ostrea edulis]XP_056014879.1 uncharacterized protein LOC125677558 [Ostrea edulis]
MPNSHCPHPTSTMEHVNNCPDSKYTWDLAAERKGCHRIFDNCLGLPKQDLKYHCLINPFLNETVEVCAPSRRMFGGFCPEYSTRAEGVQENFDIDCKKFQSSCPITFMSTEAYKYQECYTMINRRTTQSATEKPLKSHSERTSSTSSSDTKTNAEHATYVMSIVLGTIALVVVVLIFMLTLWYCSRKRKQLCKRRNAKNVKTKEEEMRRENADYLTGNDQPESYSYLVSNPNNSDECERDIHCDYTKQASATIILDDGVFSNGISCLVHKSNNSNASTKGEPSDG